MKKKTIVSRQADTIDHFGGNHVIILQNIYNHSNLGILTVLDGKTKLWLLVSLDSRVIFCFVSCY